MKTTAQKSIVWSARVLRTLTLAFAVTIALTRALWSQPIVVRGDHAPSIEADNVWFWDTLHHQIWHFQPVETRHLERGWHDYTAMPVAQVRIAFGHVWVEDSAGHGYAQEDRGTIMSEYDRAIFFGDSMIVSWRGNNMSIDLGEIYGWCKNNPMIIDTIGGSPCIAMPRMYQGPNCNCSSLHTWGLLDHEGHWRIAPQYDKPFHFQDGIAEVTYYGQKRKINEQGEFVE